MAKRSAKRERAIILHRRERARILRRRATVALGVLLLLGMLGVAGMWWLRDRAPISFGWVLRAQPEAQLFYPGSSVLLGGGQDYTVGLTGPSPAFYNVTLGVDAPDAAILDFYRQRMAGRPGWFSTTPTGGVDSRATLTWRSERFLMQIELPDPTVLRAAGHPGPNYYRLVLLSLSPR